MRNRELILVEDDPVIAHLIHRTLERAGGFKVTWTENPEEVLELARRDACCGIIMDVSLSNSRYQGKEVDGLMITRMLKSDPRTCAVPVMLLTAHAMHGDTEHLLSRSGADAYFSKPFENTRVLVESVNTLISRAEVRTRE